MKHREGSLARLFIFGAAGVTLAGILQNLLYPGSSFDIHFTDTYFVVAHLHVFIALSIVLVTFAGVYALYPRLFGGRRMNRFAGLIHFWLTVIGIAAILWPLHYEGIAGTPRRYYDYTGWESYKEFEGLNTFISIMVIVLLFAQLIFVLNFLLSLLRKRYMS